MKEAGFIDCQLLQQSMQDCDLYQWTLLPFFDILITVKFIPQISNTNKKNLGHLYQYANGHIQCPVSDVKKCML